MKTPTPRKKPVYKTIITGLKQAPLTSLSFVAEKLSVKQHKETIQAIQNMLSMLGENGLTIKTFEK